MTFPDSSLFLTSERYFWVRGKPKNSQIQVRGKLFDLFV